MISIIVRTKNEERWIRPCLEGILRQKVDHPVEVVLVDNASTDKTIERARAICPDLILVQLTEFLPGHALNEGIRASSGEYLVCLSAHCPPVDDMWLANLLRNFDEPGVAGVYGRQVPTRFTTPVDKRDLLLTFGTERRVQVRDTFFHNANSMIPRAIWDRFPFDEEITNIEDRLWGKEVIQAGLRIVYEPDASVFHHHGIHQDNRPDRARNIINILEQHLPDLRPDRHGSPFDPETQEITVIIPLRGDDDSVDFHEKLVARTMASVRESRYVKRILAATDSEAIAEMVRGMGAEVPFLRPKELSAPGIRVDDVLKQFLLQLEDDGYYPDIVVPLEVTYPFRPAGLLDEVIMHLLADGFDTVVAGLPEYRACWRRGGDGDSLLTDVDKVREKREPLHIGVPGLACATYPHLIRAGNRVGSRVGIVETHDPIAGIEIRTREEFEAMETRIKF